MHERVIVAAKWSSFFGQRGEVVQLRPVMMVQLDGEPAPIKIEPSDVDLFVEVRGRFLFIEGKGPRLAMEQGQRRALLELSKLPQMTVLVIGGDDPNAPTVMQQYAAGRALPTEQCTIETIRSFVAQWYADASRAA